MSAKDAKGKGDGPTRFNFRKGDAVLIPTPDGDVAVEFTPSNAAPVRLRNTLPPLASNDLLAGERMESHSRSLRLRACANRFSKHDSMTVWCSDDELSKSPALVGRLGDHLRTS